MSHALTIERRLDDIARRVASRCSIHDYTVEVTPGSAKGDNYLGKIYKLSIKSPEKKLSLIVKAAEGSETLRAKMPIRSVFLREIFMYERVFEEFRKMQEEKLLEEKFDAIPKCYSTIDEEGLEALALEDLYQSGFKMWDRKKPMDEEHLECVLKNYGKFHAFSFALKEQKPDVFDELTRNLENVFGTKLEDWKMFVAAQINSVEKIFDGEKEKDVLEQLREFKESDAGFEKMKEKNRFGVITHGDCWCNNMMFSYQDEQNPSTPTSIRMLDFQLSAYTSLVTDISYFFYACAPYESFRHLDSYLQVYHDSFASHLKLLGGDPSVFTFDDLKGEWMKFGAQGFIAALLVLKFTVLDVEDVPDMEELAKKDGNMLEAYDDVGAFMSKAYGNRARDLVRHVLDIGLLSGK